MHLTIFRHKGAKNLNDIHLRRFPHLRKDGSLSMLALSTAALAGVTAPRRPPRGEEFCDAGGGRRCRLLVAAAEATILCDESSDSDRTSTGPQLPESPPSWP